MPDADTFAARLVAPTSETLTATGQALETLPPRVTFDLGDRLADQTDAALQSALTGWLQSAGLRDPEGLSVFLAANAHILPMSTIRTAGKVLPEAG